MSQAQAFTLNPFDGLFALVRRSRPTAPPAAVELYSWQLCPYCIRAKWLLSLKGVSYTDQKIDGDEAARDRMAARSNGRRSVPQIFINGEWIGGCDDLYALDAAGELDRRLAIAAPPANS